MYRTWHIGLRQQRLLSCSLFSSSNVVCWPRADRYALHMPVTAAHAIAAKQFTTFLLTKPDYLLLPCTSAYDFSTVFQLVSSASVPFLAHDRLSSVCGNKSGLTGQIHACPNFANSSWVVFSRFDTAYRKYSDQQDNSAVGIMLPCNFLHQHT